jgi:hypothetical protein
MCVPSGNTRFKFQNDELTAKLLLESYFPKSLRLTDEQIRAEEKKLQPANEPPTPVKKNDGEDGDAEARLLLTLEEESVFVEVLERVQLFFSVIPDAQP